MKFKQLNKLALCVIGGALCASVEAKTSVWKVENGENLFYLGGTVHVLSESDYPLPCEFDAAYLLSEQLVFETDISSLSNPEFALKAAQLGTYPAGTSLNDKISSETLGQLTNYLESLGLPASGLMQLKPGMLMSVIVLTELQRRGVGQSAGVDLFFHTKAIKDQKPVKELEAADFQLELITNLGVGNEDAFVMYLIESMDLFRTEFDRLFSSWRGGDLETLIDASGFNQLRNEFPKVFDALIVDRNDSWLTQIESMAVTPEVEYVLVGALHMVGAEGLLAKLVNKGYTVTQLDGCAS